MVIREKSVCPEVIESGTVELIGMDEMRIVAEILALLDDLTYYNMMCNDKNPYGDGHAAHKSTKLY